MMIYGSFHKFRNANYPEVGEWRSWPKRYGDVKNALNSH